MATEDFGRLNTVGTNNIAQVSGVWDSVGQWSKPADMSMYYKDGKYFINDTGPLSLGTDTRVNADGSVYTNTDTAGITNATNKTTPNSNSSIGTWGAIAQGAAGLWSAYNASQNNKIQRDKLNWEKASAAQARNDNIFQLNSMRDYQASLGNKFNENYNKIHGTNLATNTQATHLEPTKV